MTTSVSVNAYTAIDLSKLAAPTVIETLDYDAIFTSLIQDLIKRDPEYVVLLESDPAVKLLEIVALREHFLRQDFNDRSLQLLLAFATGANLEHLGALYGITRAVVVPADLSARVPVLAVLEDDASLRRRIQLAPETFSLAGPAGAYIGHSLNASGRVKDVDAASPSPGEAVITVLSLDGDGTADDALLGTVYDYLYPRRPMADHVIVQSAVIRPYMVEAVLDLATGPDPMSVRRQVLVQVTAYVNEVHTLGKVVARARLFAALSIEGVNNVRLLSPADDVVCANTEAGYCTSISVRVA